MRKPKYKWIDGKLFVCGGASLDNYRRAKLVASLVRGQDIEVKIVRVQPPPVWEIWAHAKDDVEPVVQDAKDIPEGARFKLTTAGRVKATEIRTGPKEPISTCYICKWCYKVGDDYICEQANNPSDKKRRCKFYAKREGDGD